MGKKSRLRRANQEIRLAKGARSFFDALLHNAKNKIQVSEYIPILLENHDNELVELFSKMHNDWVRRNQGDTSYFDALKNEGFVARPPFEKTFLEFRVGDYYGVFCTLRDIDQSGIVRVDTPDENGEFYAQTTDKWILSCKIYCMVDGLVFPTDHDIKIWLNAKGQLSDDINTNSIDFVNQKGQTIAYDKTIKDYQLDLLKMVTYIVLYAFTLCNCKNVELVDLPPNIEHSALHEKHFGQPLAKRKRLRLKPVSKRSNNGESKEYQDLMPLHWRRGHFKTFTEASPRFGYAHPSNIGTFWTEATVVGSEKNGVVVKDYKVEPPKSA